MLKTYRVTFEVTQWREDKGWWVSASRYQQLELEDYYIEIPKDAKIEDITVYPLEDGYYMFQGNDRLYRRVSDNGEDTRWMYKTDNSWSRAGSINVNTEQQEVSRLTYLGPLTEEK